MSAYLIVRVNIRDLNVYKQYTAKSPDIIAKYGGRFLARGGDVETLEGDAFEGRVVLVEFPDMETARNFYNSDDYQAAKLIRSPVSDAQFLIIEGV